MVLLFCFIRAVRGVIMTNGLYAFKNADGKVAVGAAPVRASSWSMFFADLEELEHWNAGCDLSFKTITDMICYMGVSRDVSLSEVAALHFDKLTCIGCFYDLYVVRRPLFTSGGRTRLDEFAIFAYIEEDLVGILTGFSTSSADIVRFYRDITDEMNKSVCARSWRLLAERTMPNLRALFHLADEEIAVDLQEEIISRVAENVEKGATTLHPCVLVSDAYVDAAVRRNGIFTHMIAALDVIFSPRYEGAFYLTPKKSGYVSAAPSLKDMRIFEGYRPEEYRTDVNVAIAKALQMEVVGEERPIALLRSA